MTALIYLGWATTEVAAPERAGPGAHLPRLTAQRLLPTIRCGLVPTSGADDQLPGVRDSVMSICSGSHPSAINIFDTPWNSARPMLISTSSASVNSASNAACSVGRRRAARSEERVGELQGELVARVDRAEDA